MRFVIDEGSRTRLLGKLEPDVFDRPGRLFLKNVADLTHRTAQRAAKPHAADKGTLGTALVLEIFDNGFSARVFAHRSITGIASTIEEGRRPGRRPPFGPIKRWAEAHGFVPVGRGNSKFVQDIREEIRQSGTRGVHFMRQAVEVAEKALRDGVPRTEQEIHDAWERS